MKKSSKKIDRKDFLKICGGVAAGGTAGFVFSGAPFKGLQWLVEWSQDQHVPKSGKEEYLKSVCTFCKDSCEMSIRMIGERAVKVETSNSGCPFGQTALQLLYHPERISSPLKRVAAKTDLTKITGSSVKSDFVKVSWESAIQDIASRIDKLTESKKGNLIAGVSKDNNVSSALLERLLKTAGSPNIFIEPALNTLERSSLGGYIDYDFKNTDFVLSFGSRLFEGWGNHASMNKAFVEWKKKGVKFVHADSLCTRTASMADEWLNIKPGTEIFLALGVANYLSDKKEKVLTGAGKEWVGTYKKYTLEKTASITGLDKKRIADIAEAFSKAKNPVAVAGRGGRCVSSSSAEFMAVFALNRMAGSKAVKVKTNNNFDEPVVTEQSGTFIKESKKYNGIDDFIKNSNFQMLFVNESDPVYSSVYGQTLAEKMKNSFVVSISPLLNDTAMFADYIFPSVTFLEENSGSGAASLSLFKESKHAGDIIIALAKMTDKKNNFPWSSYTDAIKNLKTRDKADNISFDAKVLKDQLVVIEKTINSTNYPLSMLPVEHTAVGDGGGMAFPYVLKTIDKKTYSRSSLWVLLNRKTAVKYGLSEGDKIRIKSSAGRLAGVRVHLTGVVPQDVIAIPLGFGHRAYTKYAENKGVNPKKIMTDNLDPVTGVADWWVTKVII